MYWLAVLSLVQVSHHQPQTDDQPHKSVAPKLPSAVLGVVNVECLDLVSEMRGDPQHGEVVGPGLSGGPPAVGQAAGHQGGEAGEADGSLLTKLYRRGLHSKYHVIVLILQETSQSKYDGLYIRLEADQMAHSVATPALLCHKEPAQGTQSPLLGAFLAFRWFFMA